MSNGWIGVDLDATLAVYDGWKGPNHIGEPILPMVKNVKAWIEQGNTVKIFTARVSDGKPETIHAIKEWCKKHIGYDLEVTNVKDYGLIALFDDRAFHVIPNTGEIVRWNPTPTEQPVQE